MQCGSGRAWKNCAVLFALLVCGAHAGALRGAHADDARIGVVRVLGRHEATAQASPSGVELALENGFSVLLRGPFSGALAPGPRAPGAAGPLSLHIARQRAGAAQIDAAFVPIGPTVELSAARVRFDAAFVAERFRVRVGHRLVLAVEQPGACADAGCACARAEERASTPCWRAVAARYEGERCVARGVEAAGLRLQFGSLPLDAR